MRLIGLDPGLRLTGWGVIDVDGNRLRHVAHGVIKVSVEGSLAARLSELFEAIANVVAEQKPIEAAGAHSPAGNASSPPNTNQPAAAANPTPKQ